jgi:hypothetical protein
MTDGSGSYPRKSEFCLKTLCPQNPLPSKHYALENIFLLKLVPQLTTGLAREQRANIDRDPALDKGFRARVDREGEADQTLIPSTRLS